MNTLRFRLTHEGTSGGTVVSDGMIAHDGQIALFQRYGERSGNEGSMMIYGSVFDMVSKLGTLGTCTMEFLEPMVEE